MDTYDFVLDETNLEIFPKHIWTNSYVIFHGTSEYHSNDIESNGFSLAKAPFDLKLAKKLVGLLERQDIKPYDLPKGLFDHTTAKGLNDYLNSIEKGMFRLSFSYLSGNCVSYSQGSSKGGQSLHYISEARDIINNAIIKKPYLCDQIDKEIFQLLDSINEIQGSNGVVYAIELPKTLDGVQLEYGVIYSTLPIPKEQIIGKVIIPANIDMNLQCWKRLAGINSAKIIRLGLGKLIEHKNFPKYYF